MPSLLGDYMVHLETPRASPTPDLTVILTEILLSFGSICSRVWDEQETISSLDGVDARLLKIPSLGKPPTPMSVIKLIGPGAGWGVATHRARGLFL